MTMPILQPDLDAPILRAWARAIDEGPFASMCFGERIAFDNPGILILLGAVAAWTDRVQLVSTVIVAQLRDLVMLAKADVGLEVTEVELRGHCAIAERRAGLRTRPRRCRSIS
jgi:hypothetical protein